MHPPSLQFTFASNAATIVGGCLVTNTYKMRLPAAFISAFVISVSFILNHDYCMYYSVVHVLYHNHPSLSLCFPKQMDSPLNLHTHQFLQGILHPIIARIIWSDACNSLSPYRYCDFGNDQNSSVACGYNCTQQLDLAQRLYVLDFAGGGAVHLLGI